MGTATDAQANAALGAAWLLRRRLLDRLDAALARAGVRVLLVKGAGLAHRYAQPWRRRMADIDLLVREEDVAAVGRAMRDAGLKPQPHSPRRRHSQRLFFEDAFIDEQGGALLLVEAHTQLDKMVPRPVDYAAIFARAAARAPGASLLLPSDEDHVLLLVLHVAAADFAHPVAWQDLALLWKPPLSIPAVVRRARNWRMTTALHMSLLYMRRHGIEVGPAPLLATRPGRLRRRWAARVYLQQEYSVGRDMGWAWVQRQTALRDDVLPWCRGVVGYAVARLRDRFRPAVFLGASDKRAGLFERP